MNGNHGNSLKGQSKEQLKGDITGGLLAGLLSLPESIAFGVLVFGALADELGALADESVSYVSLGVIAGLTGLALSNLIGARFGGVRIMNTGPYSVSSLMLVAAGAVIVNNDVVKESTNPSVAALQLLLLVMFIAGFLQFIFGLLKLGDLAKYIPYPVIAGLMNGIAIVIFISQIPPLLGLESGTPPGYDRYDLKLMSDPMREDLPQKKKSLVVVALVGQELHIQIFDSRRKKVVDKSATELQAGPDLEDLKKLLNQEPFPDASEFPTKKRKDIIKKATSVSDDHRYDLKLRNVNRIEDLPKDEKSLVVVALVGEKRKKLHIQIFDSQGKEIVDKSEAKLRALQDHRARQDLEYLKKLLNQKPFPDASGFSTKKRKEIIKKATSVSDDVQLLTFLVGLITIAIIVLAPKYIKKIPGPLAGIIVGTLVYYTLRAHLSAAGFEEDWEDYLGPIIGEIRFDFPLPPHWADIGNPSLNGTDFFFFLQLIGLSLGIAVVVSLKTLLGAVAIDSVTQERSDTSRELFAQGIANMCNPIFGGITVAGYSAQPISNYQHGGRTRRSRLVVGIFALATLFFFGPLVGRIPQVVLAGIILILAYSAVDRWSITQLVEPFSRRRLNRDAALNIIILITVTGFTVGLGIFQGVYVGLLISVVIFIYRMCRKTIRRQYNGQRIRSNVERQLEEIVLLEEHGKMIEVFELEGSLFFGTTDKFAGAIEGILDSETEYIIIDFKRVNDVDSTGAKILDHLKDRAENHGKRIFLSSLNPDREIGRLMESLGLIERFGKKNCFPRIDVALAKVEDLVLDEILGNDRYDIAYSSSKIDAFSEMSPDEIERFIDYCETVEYSPGTVIFEQNTAGNEVFIIVSGRINIYSQSMGEEDERLLVNLCPGTICGEMAILDGKPRGAKAVAEGDVKCYRLSIDALERMKEEDSRLSYKFIEGLSRELAKRIRIANRSKTELQG